MRGNIPGRDEAPLAPVIEAYGLDLTGNILELGPGNGQLRPMVIRAGGKYTGVDKDANAKVITMDYALRPQDLPVDVFDGIFTRGSISTGWDRFPELMDALDARLQVGGWSWLALWLDPARLDRQMDALQICASLGWRTRPDRVGTNLALVCRGC